MSTLSRAYISKLSDESYSRMIAEQVKQYVDTITDKVISVASTTVERSAKFYINNCNAVDDRTHTALNIPDDLRETLIKRVKEVFVEFEYVIVKTPTIKNPTSLYINIKW